MTYKKKLSISNSIDEESKADDLNSQLEKIREQQNGKDKNASIFPKNVNSNSNIEVSSSTFRNRLNSYHKSPSDNKKLNNSISLPSLTG